MDNSHWSQNFIRWIEEQAAKDRLLRDTVELMLEEVKLQRQLLLKAERKIRALMSSEKYAAKSKLLRSVVGIGPKVSTLFLLEVADRSVTNCGIKA